MKAITWGPERKHDGSPDCPADARDVPCMVKGPEWEPWRTVDAHPDRTDKVYWPNVTAYRLPVAAPDTVLADLVAAAQALGAWVVANLSPPAAHEELAALDAALTSYKEQQK